MKNKILVFFVMIFVSYQSFGQGFYPFRYHILTDTVPDRYVITYTRMDTTEDAMPDSIRIDIIDSVYNPSFGFLTIIYPDTIYRIDFYSDNSQIRYNPVLKLHYSAWKVYCVHFRQAKRLSPCQRTSPKRRLPQYRPCWQSNKIYPQIYADWRRLCF